MATHLGGGGTTSRGPSAGTSFDAGDIEVFARKLRSVAEDDWFSSDSYAYKLAYAGDGDEGFPEFGKFDQAVELKNQYGQRAYETFMSFYHLKNHLLGMADAAHNIAENYQSTEELNNAGVEEIDRLLGEAMSEHAQPDAAGGQTPDFQPAESTSTTDTTTTTTTTSGPAF